MIKKTMKTLAMAFLVGTAAAVRAGDIVSIDVMEEDWRYSTLNGGKTYPNPNNPQVIGETVTIRVRLLNSSHDGSGQYEWQALPLAGLAPKLGLVVGGVPRYATLVECKPTTNTTAYASRRSNLYFTDLYFEYTVQAGDIAEPVSLMDSNGKASTGSPGESYYVGNSYYIYNKTNPADSADVQRSPVFSFISWDSDWLDVNAYYPPRGDGADESGAPRTAPQEIYIRTIDFDEGYDEPNHAGTDADPKVWRTIAQNTADSISQYGNLALLVAGTAAYEGKEDYAKMWVWTEDETILAPEGETQEFYGKNALPILISTGDKKKPFYLRANGNEGDGTWVYMSSAPTNIYNIAGGIANTAVKRYVKIGPPRKPSISLTFGGKSWASASATTNYKDEAYPVTMAVTLSESFTNAVNVIIKPYINGVDVFDTYTNHLVAVSSEKGGANSWREMVTNVVFDVGVQQQLLYVYPLGATKDTMEDASGIEFKVVAVEEADASAHFKPENRHDALLYVEPSAPDVKSVTFDPPTAGFEMENVEISIDDSCRNMRYLDDPAFLDVLESGTNLYAVTWERGIGGKGSKLELGYFGLTNGVLKISGVKYPRAGTFTATVKVTNPDGESVEVAVPVTVTEPDKIVVENNYGDWDHTYKEEEEILLSVGINVEYSDKLYAFVEPLNEAATNYLGGAQVMGVDPSKATGLEIPANTTAAIGAVKLKVNDGPSTPAFRIVLCTTKSYDSTKVVHDYASDTYYIACANVTPKGEKLVVGGGGIDVSGGQLEYSVPADNAVSLAIQIGDVEADRQLSTQPNELLIDWIDGNDPDAFTNGLFITKWSFFNAKGKNVETRITVGSSDKQAVTNFTFTSIGTNRVEVQMLDKDMIKALLDSGTARKSIVSWEGGAYGDPKGYWKTSLVDDDWGSKFIGYVPVEDKASVVIVPVNATVNADGEFGFLEGATAGGFDIVLSSGTPDIPLDVELWLERIARTDGVAENIGTLGSFELKNIELGMDTNAHVTVSFTRRDETKHVSITGMDGTPYSHYRLHAVVTTEDENDDGIKMKDYYLEGVYEFGVFNRDPKLNSITSDFIGYDSKTGLATPTNTVSLTQNQEITIDWVVSDNIRMDETNNFTVTWNSSEPGSMSKTNDVTRGTYKTKFSTAGDKTITLSINDKDGGANFYEWHFNVEASKRLYVYPHGPCVGALSEAVANSYMLADGLGVGTAEASGALGDILEFAQTWDFSVNDSTATIYARGLRAGETDTNIIARASRLGYPTQTGTLAASAAEAYRNDVYTNLDSFVYAYIANTVGDNSVFTPTLVKIDPQLDRSKSIQQPVSLPLAEKDAVAYPDRYMEIIFSREWLEADNLGDINADGIPDAFAVKIWRNGRLLPTAAAGTTTAIGSDLVDLAALNDDEDLLPGIYRQGDTLAGVSGSASSYAPLGLPLTAKIEIRGFNDGLNARDRGTSDISFGDDEEFAWQTFVATNNLGLVVETDDGSGNVTVTTNAGWIAAEERNLSIWSPEPGSPEFLRMDPTMDDTDGDGFPDGWEYFFWYQARVWGPSFQWRDAHPNDLDSNGNPLIDKDAKDARRYPGQPRAGQHFLFERFNLDNILVGTEITFDEVMERFNPCVKFDPDLAPGEKYLHSDFDGDGLSDLEELVIGTNPCHWDTDGDRLCDGWEVMMCLDPLNGSKSANDDHDFMAFHSTYSRDMVWVDPDTADDPYAEGARLYAFDNLEYGIDYELDINTFKYVMIRTVTKRCFSFTPKYIDGEPLVYGLEADLPGPPIPSDWVWGFRMVDAVIPEEWTLNEGDVLETNLRFALVHDQVRDGFGFDPRTGWSNVGGYVSSRWDPNSNSDNVNAFDDTGLAVNTRPYQAYDEYLLLKYRADYGIDYSPNTSADGGFDPAKETVWSFLRRKTTNPNYVYPVVSATNDTETVTTNVTASASVAEALAEAFRQAGSDKGPVIDHGADTDHDGVPDGWELYMYRNPNASPIPDDEDGLGQPDALDFDGDELSWADEYAGVDACNVYKDCESIYRHHPGTTQGWWNKFFPTNPGTMKRFSDSLALLIFAGNGNADGADTDLDGVPDNIEGGVWGVVFANADNQWPAELGFVYGSPEDDGLTVCFRGGGMNPCTIDTDLDGIPDGWEMQHAGVPVNLPDLAIVAPRGGDVEDIELDKATFIADGIYTGVSLSNGVYIAGGMDATWKGDAVFDDFEDPEFCLSYDSLLGTRRDVDFDHDGLQNYQEYLVQSIRHFRYDDITTPLMGRQFEEGEYDPVSKRVVSPHSQSFGDSEGETDGTGTGYPVFDASDPGTTAANAAEAWNGRSFVYYETVTTGVREVVRVVDPYTGEVETNKIYYTAQKKRFTDGASLVAKHVAAGGTRLQYAWNEEGWRSLGYFAAPRRSWDRAVASNKLGSSPLYMWPITGSMAAITTSVGGYASTDPRLADTDGDGMDDFYELYHGLNPILGTTPANAAETSWIGSKSGDIISAQYWMSNYSFDSRPTFNAWYNEWIYPTYSGLLGRAASFPGDAVGMPLQAPQAWDPVLYPWAVGSPRADADGDGIANDEERIIANVADPVGRHTDPTPLWFTERTTPASYVAQYYMLPSGVGGMPWAPAPNDDFQEASLRTETDSTRDLYISGAYTYSFEENEGYDTDGDMTPDSGEVVSKVKPASDPLRFDDPDRRQALYLPGENAYAVSRDIQIRPIDSEDFLKQFTVECWILPERTDVAQTVVERTVAYEGDSIGTAAYALRANFRIGIDAQGVVYGMFDNNDSIESGLNSPNSCQFVKGKEVTAGKWTHVALSFDGKVLSLYIDGYPVKRAPTGLTPANGVVQIRQNPGNTAAFTAYEYRATPCALLIGARPKAKNLYALYPYFINELGMHMESFDNVQEYFKGYVDEVRVWDGARTSQQILANYRKAMGYADAAANRSEVFEVYAQAGTRNNNDGNLTLPPELVLNYGFSTLPGAVNAADVAKVPGGFYAKVLDAAMSDYASNPDIDRTGLYDNILELKGAEGGWVAGDLLVGWWNDSLLKSTVYDDYHVVPWIRNTVSHLPLMDGSSPDSFVYGDYFGAVYTPASEHGLAKYTFPNSAVPYPTTVRNLDAYYRLAQAARRVEQLGGVYSNALVECQFQVRNNFVGTADLIPLGGAYAKTCPKLWDGDVADPWEQTLSDANGDGIPDWWEEYARYNYAPDVDPAMAVGWDTLVDYHGTSMKAGLAYVIDIYRGLQPDGSIDPAYAVNTDSDGDSIPDWWENIFGIASQGADDDADNDGLSNYAEYTVSFGPYPYGLTNGWHFLSPVDAYSTSLEQKVTDYFLRAPKAFDDAARHVHAGEYYGEIFTDHDMMEAWWEKTYAPSYASSYAYDAGRDADGDGWDNWSEVRSATWCGTLLADLVTKYLSDQVSLKNYPQPAIGIRFTYPEGNVQDISGRSVVVRTMTSGRARTDATFTIVAPQAADVGTASHTVGAFIDTETPIRSYLQPGSIVPTSCYVYGVHLSKDGVYYWGISETLLENFGWGSTAGTWIGERTLSRTDGSSELCWYCTGTYDQYVTDVRAYGRANVILDNPGLDFDLIGKALSRDDGRMGDFKIMSAQTEAQSVFGTVNFLTGEFTLDPAPLEDAGLAPAGMLVKIEYTYSVSTEWPQTLWFNNPSSGRVRQGLNTIEAWIDLNGDGGYTAGEPYGIVRNVNIGWHRTAETVIELRDTSTIIPHYLLSDGSSDRTVVQGVAGGVVASPSAGGGEGEDQEGEQGGLTTKIVVRRIGINGESLYGHKTVPNRTLVSKTYVIGDRAYLTEADVLSDDKFDLDWKWLVNDAVKLGLAASDIKTAEYEISQVATLAGGTVTNISLATFSNAFNSQRPVPVARAPIASAPVYSAAPTFSWTCADDTMTAFRLQISTSTNQSDVVYDSGIQHLPGRDYLAPSTFAHSFTPPFYVNDPVATNGAFVVADATNYFWRVTEYNAKYSATDAKAWSAWTSFQMDVRNENRYPKLSTGYGKCGAVVRYFGPNTNDLEGIVVVEAHRSADFTDQPLAQLRADVSQLADETDISTVNAAFTGIEPGEVFMMAYIDANNNGKRDATESWGYANYVGTERLSIYTPRGVTVTDELYLSSEPPKLVVYIEDVDVNRNEIPDCLETAVAGSAEVQADTDKDGLADADEDGFGTDSSVWDTDGDGMPDGWEALFAELDPNFEDADEVADDDVMAFAVVDATVVTVQNTANGSDAHHYILKTGAKAPVVGDSADALELFEIYEYPVVVSNEVVNYYGRGAPVALAAEAGTTNRVMGVTSEKVALVHAQVYDEYGFNAKTAVPGDDSVNTKPFTALDKYLVVRYLESIGICGEEAVNVGNLWPQYTLRPFDADFDRDGVADGWELYVMFGPAADKAAAFAAGDVVSPWNFDDRFLSFDEGGLALVYEYDGGSAPTDPWNDHTVSTAFTDYGAWRYNLKTPEAQLSDADNDGLSNIQEYRAYADWGLDLDVAEMKTDGETIDYFRIADIAGNQHYIGEVVADHDFMEDYLEDESGYDRGLYDATKDADRDGWSNWAETRAYVESGVEYVADIVSNRVIRTNISVEEYDTIRNNYDVIEDTINFNARYDDAGNLIGSTVTGSIIYFDTQAVMRVQSLYSGTPYPTVHLTVAYNGEKDIDAGGIVVEAYSNAKMQKKLCSWTLTQEGFSSKFAHNGYIELELKVPDHGYLKEGTTHFAVFADMNSDGVYSGAEPFGIAKDVKVGYDRTTDFTVELKDITPVVPRIDFANLTCDRVTLEGITTNTSNVAWGDAFAIDGEEVRVRVIRTAINGDESAKKRTLLNRVFRVANRSYLHEGDFMTSLKNDLDPYLALDAKAMGIAPSAVSEATYEVVLGNAKYKAGSTNENEGVVATFVNSYPKTRATGTPLAPSANSRGVLTTSQATFDFTADTSAYTAYVLEVSENEGFTTVLHSTTNLLTGAVKGIVSATPAWYFDDGKTYYWRVALLNGKYSTLEKLASSDVVWSEPAKFTVGLRGEATAEVKYFGPAETDGKVVVEAYLSPDFVGDPIARVVGGSLVDGTNALAVAGLQSGEVYLLAFIDRNGDGVRQSYESWGYACKVGTTYADIWTPVPVTINAVILGDPVVAAIYIEDTDINQNFTADPLDDEEDLKAAEEAIASEGVDDDSGDMSDRDGDGLRGFEEEEIGTDPDDVDSDGDGMWDGWEVWAGTDPLSAEDATEAADGDVMAYDEINRTIIKTRSTMTGLEAAYILPEGADVPHVGDNMNGADLYRSYEYGSPDLFGLGTMTTVPTSAEYILATVENEREGTNGKFLFPADVQIDVGTNVTDYVAYEVAGIDAGLHILGNATNLVVDTSLVDPTSSNVVTAVSVVDVSLGENRVIEVIPAATVALIHNQVYQEYGYNQRTAVGALPEDDRINTKPFTALDKYLLIRYYEALSLCDEAAVNAAGEWDLWSLKPGVIDGDWGDAEGRYGDGIADGWELYIGKNPWDFGDRFDEDDGDGLALYLEFDSGNLPTDPWLDDTDGDEVSDYYAYFYHLKGDQAGADNDGDGLSNYAEYLISEVLQIVKVHPDEAKTSDSTLDYYKKFGDMYLGEIFADHDRIADDWEALYETGDFDGQTYAARGVYDPDLDLDGDGWSNYAEYRAGTSPEKETDVGIDNYTLIEHPVPVVEMDVSYDGLAYIEGATLTVKAWNERRDPDALGAPDATWTVTTLNENETATQQNAETGEELKEKYIGRMPTGTRTYYLGNGAIKEASFKLCIKDKNWVEGTIVELYGEQYFQPTKLGSADSALWFYGVIDRGGKLVTRGGIFAQEHEVGTIDYDTGRVTINFDDKEFTDELMVGDPKDAEGGENTGNTGATTTYHGLNPPTSYVKFTWSPVYSMPVCGLHYLSDPATGRLLEGPTTFTVEYTASDTATAGGSDSTSGGGDLNVTTRKMLYGVVRGVDVGWSGAKFKVELTDANPVTQRMDLRSGEVDRTDYVPYDDIRVSTESNRFEAVTAVGSPVRVRVVRNAINGYQTAATWGDGMADVIYDKLWYGDGRSLLSELDFLEEGMFDIDWTDTFQAKVASATGITRGADGAAGNVAQVIGAGTSVTNMEYLVVLGDGEANWSRAASTNVVYGFAEKIVRRFDRVRATAVPTSSLFTQYSARPTFTWRMDGEEEEFVKRFGSSYTAFRLQVLKGTDVVYDSGTQRAPATDTAHNFSWTAPICAGAMLTSGSLFETAGATYSWRVTMYNAKFRSDAWSAPSDFVTAVNNQQEVNDRGYSSIGVAAKYAGPTNVLAKCTDMATPKGKVVVQAFSMPDFSGEPLAAGIATTNVAELATGERNAWIKGLPAIGTYYVRAFIDMDGDGKLSKWEPWGYAPDAVTLVNDGTMAGAPVVPVWIDDSDSDRDWLPDSYEYAANGWTGDWDTEVKGKLTPVPMGDGGIDLTIPLASIVNNGAAISRGLPGASLTVLQSAEFVSAVLGLSVKETTTIDAINAAVKAKIATNSVKIVSFALEPDGSAVNITVGAEVASGIAGSIVSKLYKFDGAGEVNVKVKVLKKDSLDEATWTEYYTSTDSVTLTSETTGTVKVPLDPTLDLTSGFFRIELIEE